MSHIPCAWPLALCYLWHHYVASIWRKLKFGSGSTVATCSIVRGWLTVHPLIAVRAEGAWYHRGSSIAAGRSMQTAGHTQQGADAMRRVQRVRFVTIQYEYPGSRRTTNTSSNPAVTCVPGVISKAAQRAE
ncbi:hypothetical protein GY45DRAFT_364663 [Cubamyces sp. BRFM 1775]|nr:hypothetical protein GY45DRAFT_364663 [Cubamyces sp. BRFM 1775]